jgi:hypothetical protein
MPHVGIVPADGGPPTPVAHHVLVLETRKMLRQPAENLFNILRQLQAMLRVQTLALLFAQGLGRLFAAALLGGARAAFDGTLKTIVEIHGRADGR